METIALIEHLDSEGQVLQMHRVHHWPQRLGRAVDNDFVIDDPYVAAHHATLAAPPHAHSTAGSSAAALQTIELTVGPSVNGVSLPAKRKGHTLRHAGSGQTLDLSSGAVFQLGGVLLRLRLPSEVLPPEQPLPVAAARRPWTLPIVGLLGLTTVTFDTWTQSDSSTSWLDFVTPAPAAALIFSLWCIAWALLAKLFQGRFAFTTHLAIALPWWVGLTWSSPLLHQASFALDWPSLSRVAPFLAAAAVAAMLWLHLSTVLPKQRLSLAVMLSTGFAALSLLTGYHHYKTEKRWFEELYASTLSVPAMRLAPAQPIERFVQSLQPLQAQLIEQVHDDEDEETAAE